MSRDVVVRIVGDASSLNRTFGQVEQKTSGLGGKFRGLSTAVKIGAAAAGVALVKFGKDSVDAFKESQDAQTRLSDAFAKFPSLADTNIGALRKLNTELAQKTRFDDDATASGQAVLAQFKLTGAQLVTLTPLLQDYAAKTGRDLPEAATNLGRAFLGNTRALKELGINYKITGDKAQDQANITALLRQQVGGFAEKEGKTAAGQAAILGNQFGEVQETVGSKLVPVLVTLTEKLLQIINFVQRNQAVIVPLVAVLGTLAAVVWAVSAAARAYIAVQTALNIVLSLNPIGAVILLVAALAAGLIIAYKKSETFRDVVNAVFAVVQRVVGIAVGIIIGYWHDMLAVWLTVAGGILSGATHAFGWVPGLGGKLKAANRAFNTMKDEILGTLSDIEKAAFGWGKGTGDKYADGLTAASPQILKAAQDAMKPVGWAMKQQSPAKIGPLSEGGGTAGWGRKAAELFSSGLERGMASVRRASQVFAGGVTRPDLGLTARTSPAGPAAGGGGGGGNTYVTVNAPNYVGSREELGRAVQEALVRIGRRNGSALGDYG
jgi:hypothetical protein